MLDEALAGLDETTEVTVGTDARVAGRDVYELILTPRTADTLVGELRFAIDGENGVALAASVTARGADEPAFEIALHAGRASRLPIPRSSRSRPATTSRSPRRTCSCPRPRTGPQAPPRRMATDAPVVYGEGWSAVVELPERSEAGSGNVFAGLDPEQLAMLESVTTAVDGGRVLQTSLVTVLITDDGRVLAGAVPADRLVEAAQTGR